MGSHLRFFLDLLCAKVFFGPFLCGGTSQKNLGNVGAGVRRMGSHLTWPHGLQCRRLFLDPFCVVGRSKKNLGSVGAGVPFSGQVFFQTFLE